MLRPITDEQLIFRDEFLSTGNVATAAEKVGKTRQWGYKQLKLDYMQKGYDARAAAIAKEEAEYPPIKFNDRPVPVLKLDRIVDRKAWLEGVILGTELETVTIHPKDGDPFEVQKPFPAAVRAKCLELLGRMSGDYVDRAEIKETKEEIVTFIQITNGRGPVPNLLGSPAKSLAEDADSYLECAKCKELILEKMHAEHEKACPGT